METHQLQIGQAINHNGHTIMLTLILLAEVTPSSTSMLNMTAFSIASNLNIPLVYVWVETKPSDPPSDPLLTSITPVNVFFGVGDDCT